MIILFIALAASLQLASFFSVFVIRSRIKADYQRQIDELRRILHLSGVNLDPALPEHLREKAEAISSWTGLPIDRHARSSVGQIKRWDESPPR